VVFESGEGAMLKDVEGKEYLDAMAGITVAHLGHGRKDLAQVAYEQVQWPSLTKAISSIL
jgi:adenosylmethionine-8-amino-7-oxononanoate aminotransferase